MNSNGTERQSRFTGIKLLTDNVEAWQAKRDLIKKAQHSLALAYFIVEADGTTCQLMLDLIDAAKRGPGVKVRLLVDYFMTFSQASMLRTLAAAHKNIEVRRYRPPTEAWIKALKRAEIDEKLFVNGLVKTNANMLAEAIKGNTIFPVTAFAAIQALHAEPGESRMEFALRVLATLPDLTGSDKSKPDLKELAPRVGEAIPQAKEQLDLAGEVLGGLKDFLRRMHHKLLLADDHEFIMGGRNLADAYHRGHPPKGHAFQDTEVRARDDGPDRSEHVAAFEKLWTCEMAVDIVKEPDPLDDTPALPLKFLENKAREVESLKPAKGATPARDLPDMEGTIVNNLPNDAGDTSITKAYVNLIREATKRGSAAGIDIVSAYLFFVDKTSDGNSLFELRESLLAARKAGVTVNIYTNSIWSTDLKPVNSAAYPRLIELIDEGVNIFELNVDQGSLHTKSAAFANDCLVVGSYNMDPRSELFDTNNLIVLRDKDGLATAAFRDTRINALEWTQLTKQSVRVLSDEASKTSASFAAVKVLL